MLLIFHGSSSAAGRLNLVVLVDLTQSVAVQNLDGKPKLQKNLDAVTRILARGPAGARYVPQPVLEAVMSMSDNDILAIA